MVRESGLPFLPPSPLRCRSSDPNKVFDRGTVQSNSLRLWFLLYICDVPCVCLCSPIFLDGGKITDGVREKSQTFTGLVRSLSDCVFGPLVSDFHSRQDVISRVELHPCTRTPTIRILAVTVLYKFYISHHTTIYILLTERNPSRD